jgi:hypothetical protein
VSKRLLYPVEPGFFHAFSQGVDNFFHRLLKTFAATTGPRATAKILIYKGYFSTTCSKFNAAHAGSSEISRKLSKMSGYFIVILPMVSFFASQVRLSLYGVTIGYPQQPEAFDYV